MSDEPERVKLPKLKVEGLGWEASGSVYDLKQARHFPFGQNVLIEVEEHIIRSYEDLVRIVQQPEYKNRELLEVKFLEIVVGG